MRNRIIIITISLILIITLVVFSFVMFNKEYKQKQNQNKTSNNFSYDNKKEKPLTKEEINQEKYENNLRDKLDYYYKNNKTKEIEKLSKGISIEGKEIVNNYKEAAEERDKKDLNYQTKVVLATISEKDSKKAEDIASYYRGTIKNKINLNNEKTLLVIDTSLEYTVAKAVSNYEMLDEVEMVQPNYKYELLENKKERLLNKKLIQKVQTNNNLLSLNINDTDKNFLWHLDKDTGVDIQPVWDLLDGIPNKNKVKVAVIDTGVHKTHEDLQTALLRTKSVTIDDNNGRIVSNIADSEGHGTHVSGIIAATSNNNKGVAGVAAGNQNDMLQVVAVDAWNETEKDFFTIDLVKAIDYVSNLGVKAINFSLGGYIPDETLHNAIKNAYDNGISCIAAAGNDEPGNDYYTIPSDFDECISVIALDGSNSKANYSNYGSAKDISAPGGSGECQRIQNGICYMYPDTAILSTVPSSSDAGSYEYMPGTSMAAPVVTGIVGMMYSAKPTLTPPAIQSFIENNAIDLGDEGKDNTYGYGKINPIDTIKYSSYTDLNITTTTLTDATRELNYSQKLIATGYPTDFEWTKTSGELPNGLSLSESGVISGIPTEIGTFTFEVKVSNKTTADATKTFTLKVSDRNITPSNFQLYLNSYNSVTISCNSIPGIYGYKVWYRRAGTTKWYSYTTTSRISKKYSLAKGYKYYFKIQALGKYGTAYSTTKSIYTLKKPTLKLSRTGSRTIRVKWSNIPGESGYRIYRKTAGKKWKLVKTRSYKYKSWKNKKRIRGKRYYYKVRAYKWVNGKRVYSQYSKTKKITR